MALDLPDLNLDPAEQLLAAIVKRALWDAQQTQNPKLQQEARQWLWQHCPTIASMAQLPAPEMLAGG